MVLHEENVMVLFVNSAYTVFKFEFEKISLYLPSSEILVMVVVTVVVVVWPLFVVVVVCPVVPPVIVNYPFVPSVT